VIDRAMSSKVAPLVAVAAGAVVFVLVLLSTPPGLVAIPDAVRFPPNDPRSLSAAYTAGAAASLAIVTMLVVGLVLAVGSLLTRGRKDGR
jgi:hypothetical protein